MHELTVNLMIDIVINKTITILIIFCNASKQIYVDF